LGTALLAVGVLAAVAFGGSRSLDESVAHAAAGKPVVCKAGQVRVTLLGKVRCRTLRTAAPTADQRLPLLRGVLGQSLPPLPTRSGRRILPLSSVAGGRVRAVQTRLVRSLPKILAWADSRVRTNAARTAAAPCAFGGPDNSTTLDGFHISLSQSGDLSVDANLPGGYRVEVFVGSGVSCSQLVLPDCPRADGGLDGTDVHSNRITLRVTQNGALVQSVSTNVRSNQTMRGKVADDAKLDAMTLTDTTTETTTVRVPGDRLVMVLSVRRTADINMRTGSPRGTPTVRASLVLQGATQSFRAQVGADVQRKYEQSFPSLIAEEVRNYRARESAWQAPGKCAKPTFSPPSNTIKVRKNVAGQVTANVESNQGGVAADGRWKVTAQTNGTFSPQEARGGSATFQYTPTASGPEVKLNGTFRATSTAGVAEGTWTQDAPPTINRIAGTFGGTWTAQTMLGPGVISFNGSVTFDRLGAAVFGGADGAYSIGNGGYTLSFSGIDISGATGCQMTGTGSFTIPPGLTFGSISVTGTGPNLDPPYTYTFSVLPGATDRVTVTRHTCPPGAEDAEGTTVELGAFASFNTMGGNVSPDGLTFAGSEDQTFMGSGQIINWSFQGSE
jgi:hypothetical protein